MFSDYCFQALEPNSFVFSTVRHISEFYKSLSLWFTFAQFQPNLVWACGILSNSCRIYFLWSRPCFRGLPIFLLGPFHPLAIFNYFWLPFSTVNHIIIKFYCSAYWTFDFLLSWVIYIYTHLSGSLQSNPSLTINHLYYFSFSNNSYHSLTTIIWLCLQFSRPFLPGS